MPRSVMVDYTVNGPQFRQAAMSGKKSIREPTHSSLIRSLAELAEIPLEEGDCLRMEITIATAKVKLKGFKLRPNLKYKFQVQVRCLDCGAKYHRGMWAVTFVKNGVGAANMAAGVSLSFRHVNEDYLVRKPYHKYRKTTYHSSGDCTCPKCHSFHVTPISIKGS